MRKTLTPLRRRFIAPEPHFALAIFASAGLLNASAVLAQQMQAPNEQAAPAKAPARQEADKPEDAIKTVIVTGTVGATEARRANVSYSVLDKKDLGKFVPISADDFLRDMPGVVVESNDGVARNESFTRGMTVGTGSPTSGNFWTSILEDGLPVTPVKFNNFQDANFYRADISTSRVESVRGGSAGTSVASSSGGVFNFLPGKIQPGTALQTRFGVEGTDHHLSWKQVDAYYGWRNEAGDLRASATGFARTSTGPVDPGYALNHGGQVKLRVQKTYELGDGGGGSVSVTAKHLDDTNSWGSQFALPVHGYIDPQSTAGFPRSSNVYFHVGQHTVRTDVVDGPGSTIYQDPEKGANYKQDAVWLKWDHDTGGRWSFNSAVKWQDSQAFLNQGFYNAGPTSLWDVATFQNAFSVNQGAGAGTAANLNRVPGYYEIYDIASGAVRARVNNNVGTSNGVNYRTGAPCPAGAATSPQQCVVFTNLPNANFDLGGGLVNGAVVPSATSVSNQDNVYTTNTNMGTRASRDFMVNFMANYTGDNFRVQGGLFAVQANQYMETYYNGRGISAFANGQIRGLGVRYVTNNNTYQLTDEGGWGRVGGGYVDGGFTAYSYRSRQRDIQPMLGASWSPGNWDFNGSYKGTLTLAKTYTVPFVTNPQSQGLSSLQYGGLDGNPLTWYDNQNYIRGTPVEASKRVYLKNYSVSGGYNFTPEDKVYYRRSQAGNNIQGILNRYQTQFNADHKPLFPQADQVQDEVAWVFSRGALSGQVTAFRTELLLWQQQTPLNVDGTTYVVEYLDHYLTKGVESWLKWQVNHKLSWSGSALYSKGRALAVGTFGAGSPGPQDDTLRTDSGIMSRTPKWVLSSTLSYEMGDFQFNLRNRYMSRRKMNNNPLDLNYLPQQRNTDLSVQYVGIKNLRLSFDIRNVLNNKYISGYDTVLPTVSGVTKGDIMQQLPNSAGWVVMNPERSFWLTARYEF